MASNIISLLTWGEQSLNVLDSDPSISGFSSALGSLAVWNDSTNAWFYLKYGNLDTNWALISTSASGGLGAGVAGELPIYNNTSTASGTYVQNAKNINVAIAAQGSRSVDLSYVLPNPGNAVSSANILLSEGAQTVNGAMTLNGGLDVAGNVIANVGTPVLSTDAANKGYVDAVANGFSWKNEVRAATTADITLSGAQTIDGVSVIAGDRVLVKAQTNAAQNGIYVAASGAWSRAEDANSGVELLSAAVFVNEGTVYGNTAWVQSVNAPITVGTTNLNFVQFAGAGTYTAGNGIAISGMVISANIDTASGLYFNSAQVSIKLDGSTLAQSINGLKVSTGGISNNEIASNAAISLSKLASLTASSLLVSNGSGVISASTGSGFVKVASGVPSYQSSISLTADVSGVLPVANGGTNLSSLGSANQLLSVNPAGSALEYKTLSGTANQVSVAFGSGTATLSLPQDIATSSSPTFAGVSVSALTSGSVVFAGASGALSQNNSKLFFDNTNFFLGIGTNAPARPLDVNGSAIIRSSLRVADAAHANTNWEMMQNQVSTTNATNTQIMSYASTSGFSYYVRAIFVGKRTGGTSGSTGDSAVYVREARFVNVGGTLSIFNLQSSFTSEAQLAWDATLVVSGTNIVGRVTGASNNNIDWTVTYEVIAL